MRSQRAYTRFLVALLLLLLIQPLTVGESHGLTVAQAARSLLVTGILVAGMLASCTSRQQAVIGLSLAVLALVAVWLLPILEGTDSWIMESDFEFVLASCPALFFFYIAGLTLRYVLSEGSVTLETIFAALCVYLLVGFAFSLLYLALDYANQAAFRIPEGLVPEWADFVFFSFVTMTTLGYGDIVPVNDWAKIAAVLQTIFAVFYLAVLISRLVGSYQVHRPPDGGAGEA